MSCDNELLKALPISGNGEYPRQISRQSACSNIVNTV